MNPLFHIVLVAPEIPLNTGSIGRVCVCLGVDLHLIEPLGFSLDSSRVRRAGLDYWHNLTLTVHPNWPAFLQKERPGRLFFSSSKGKKIYWDYSFQEDDYLIFGSETRGLPESFYDRYEEQLYTIPMPGPHSRTLNLSNAVSLVAYEAFRQISFSSS